MSVKAHLEAALDALVLALTLKLEEGTATASDMEVLRKVLYDNKIECTGAASNPESKLGQAVAKLRTLPFPPPEEDVAQEA
jgi:hypothetical protein